MNLRAHVPALLALNLIAAAALAAPKATMLAPRAGYDPEQVSARTGEKWTGLFFGDDGFELRPVTLQVSQVVDDEDEGAMPTKMADIAEDAAPALIIDDRTLPYGRIETAFSGEASIPRGGSMALSLGGSSWKVGVRLTARAAANEPLAEGEPECELYLEHGGTIQVLQGYAHVNGYDPGTPYSVGYGAPIVTWAGDMDGDGKLDLLVTGQTADGEDVLRLYLSSHAAGAPFVGSAGELPVDLEFGC